MVPRRSAGSGLLCDFTNTYTWLRLIFNNAASSATVLLQALMQRSKERIEEYKR